MTTCVNNQNDDWSDKKFLNDNNGVMVIIEITIIITYSVNVIVIPRLVTALITLEALYFLIHPITICKKSYDSKSMTWYIV